MKKNINTKYRYVLPAKTTSGIKSKAEEPFFGDVEREPFFKASNGISLPINEQQSFGKKLGHDFSDVKIHTGHAAALAASSIQAKAFTKANHIVFNENEFNPATGEGNKLLVHELMHVVQAEKNPQAIFRKPKSGDTQWNTWITQGFADLTSGNPDSMETNFAAAVRDLGYTLNVARNGRTDTSKLKPGLNLDINYTDYAGESGFLTNGEFVGRMPLDDPNVQLIEIIGKAAFRTGGYFWTKMVIEHEKTHTLHHQKTIDLYKSWAAKNNTQKFRQKLVKEQKAFEKRKGLGRPSDEVKRDNDQLKVDHINKWLRTKSKASEPDIDLFSEIAGTMKAQHQDTEVLSGLNGFMSTYHEVPVVNGKPAVDVFDELTFYPAAKGFWNDVDPSIKKKYEAELKKYYSGTLNDQQRLAFDQQVKDYQAVFTKAIKYFSMLNGIVKTGK